VKLDYEPQEREPLLTPGRWGFLIGAILSPGIAIIAAMLFGDFIGGPTHWVILGLLPPSVGWTVGRAVGMLLTLSKK
jgi:hypothetical protein